MNNDILLLLTRIKDNIKIVENGDTNQSILDEIQSDFLQMIDLMKLFLISERDSYYGYFFMNMRFNANFSSNSIAGIKLNTFPPVFEANPLLLCKYKLKEILYIMCHEIDHVLFNHPAEMVKANPSKDPDTFYEFNLAADACVNDRIDWEKQANAHNYLSRPDGVITSDVLAKMYHLKQIRKLENYAYYFDLIKGIKQGDKPDLSKNGAQSMMNEQNKKDGVGISETASQDDSQNQESEEDSSKGNDVVTATNCNGKISDHNWEAGDDEEDVTATVKEFVNSVFDAMNDETRGLMPAHFTSQVEKLNEPPVLSWQKILKKYVGTITANKRKTRTRLNRRQPERFDLSGSMDDKVIKIVVAIDTSGSVNDEMIARIFNEIFSILAKRKHDITVIECDAEVQRVYKAKTPDDIKTKVAGRGGTWFSPVIEYINKNKYFRDALLIYFTDGYGETEIPRPLTYRNLWVVIDDAKNLSVKEPYGVVLTL